MARYIITFSQFLALPQKRLRSSDVFVAMVADCTFGVCTWSRVSSSVGKIGNCYNHPTQGMRLLGYAYRRIDGSFIRNVKYQAT